MFHHADKLINHKTFNPQELISLFISYIRQFLNDPNKKGDKVWK